MNTPANSAPTQVNSPLATTNSSDANTASGIPFIKSRGRTVPKPFNLSSSKKRDISQVSNSSEGKKIVDQNSSKKLKPTLQKTSSGVPFIKKKDATVCEPPKFLTTAKREVKKQSVQKKPEKTPFSVEEDVVENVMKEIHAQNFKKDVTSDIEKVKVPVDVLISRLNIKMDELKNTYQFNVQSVDLSLLKNFCRQHSKKFEIAQDKEKNQKVVRLKKPSVLKTVNTIISKPLKSVLIATIKTQISTPVQQTISEEQFQFSTPQQTESIPQEQIQQTTTELEEQQTAQQTTTEHVKQEDHTCVEEVLMDESKSIEEIQTESLTESVETGSEPVPEQN